jgi:hypothetical protein
MEASTISLSQEQIETFLTEGVLVVENVLTDAELAEAIHGLHATLAVHGIDCSDLASTGHALRSLSSTNGSGGVLDLFYDAWKLRVATNPRLFYHTSQLWQAAYCHDDESKEDLDTSDQYKWHHHGAFDISRGYCYLDRIGYRLPSKLAEELGAKTIGNVEQTKKKRSALSLQRSLTPHLDCCPDNFFAMKTKWRPIQCFVSLTDNLEVNTGGFEAAPGFHREFDDWARHRPPTISTTTKKGRAKNSSHQTEPLVVSVPAPCIGEYTHIRPKEDAAVLKRIQHIPVPAAGAVFWDNRIPHGNAFRHVGPAAAREGTTDVEPRAVVYCSFLPDVAINRSFAQQQLENWQKQINPCDQWIAAPSEQRVPEEEALVMFHEQCSDLSPLSRRLLMIDPW